jgi:hypothetical protein
MQLAWGAGHGNVELAENREYALADERGRRIRGARDDAIRQPRRLP